MVAGPQRAVPLLAGLRAEQSNQVEVWLISIDGHRSVFDVGLFDDGQG